MQSAEHPVWLREGQARRAAVLLAALEGWGWKAEITKAEHF